jgi:hypothetical protein
MKKSNFLPSIAACDKTPLRQFVAHCIPLDL